MSRTDGRTKTNNRVAVDLVVRWFDSGTIQVSNSKHDGWYDIGHDAFGNLICTCRDFAYRGCARGYCKHTWTAAEYLSTHAPTTDGQRQFDHATFGDGASAALRHMQECEDGSGLDHYGPCPWDPTDADGVQALEDRDEPEEQERPATTANPRLETLFE